MTLYGEQVRKARNLQNFSQETLAIAAGLSKRTIQNVEAGNLPGAETRRALAAVLGDALSLDERPAASVPEWLYPRSAPMDTASLATSHSVEHLVQPTDPTTSPQGDIEGTEEAQRVDPVSLATSRSQHDWALGYILKMTLSGILLWAVVSTLEHFYEPTLWVTVDAPYRGLTPGQEAENLRSAINSRFPDIRHVEPLSSVTFKSNTRRTFSVVSHGTDPAALSDFLGQIGTSAEVSTIAPDD